ncbi:MAG: oxidoreductase [Ktedonobacteraceae bacterium]
MSHWTTNDIPDLQGSTVLVTGANSGLGLATTRALAAKGAHVIMACRNLDRARAAQASITASVPRASLELVHLDLASLASVRDCAASVLNTHDQLTLLFNNAGVMAIPRRETEDGFEMQFGSNHLGHFALTGLALPLLLATPGSRVVTTTSLARSGKVLFDDLHGARSYSRWGAYGQSKTANLLFAFELQRRLAATGAPTISVAAHPGYANTSLQSASAASSGSRIERVAFTVFGPLVGQSPAMGALPQLYGGTAPDVRGGMLIGPGGFFGLRGYPKPEPHSQREDDRPTAARLWDVSVALTGVDYAPLHLSRPLESR